MVDGIIKRLLEKVFEFLEIILNEFIYKIPVEIVIFVLVIVLISVVNQIKYKLNPYYKLKHSHSSNRYFRSKFKKRV